MSLFRQLLQNPGGSQVWESVQDSPPQGEEKRNGRQKQLWLGWGHVGEETEEEAGPTGVEGETDPAQSSEWFPVAGL